MSEKKLHVTSTLGCVYAATRTRFLVISHQSNARDLNFTSNDWLRFCEKSRSRGCINTPLGYVHATRKAAFFRQVKLRSSRVAMETRELRSFTFLKKAAFLVA